MKKYGFSRQKGIDMSIEITANKEEWLSYFKATKENPPSQTALDAAERLGKEYAQVIDLGCGAGTDTLFFLNKGLSVLAIDMHTEYLEALFEEMPQELQKRLEICQMSFEQLTIPEPADCVIANFSLPFCNPNYFSSMWQALLNGLKPSGIFSGVFFGNRDDWAELDFSERTFHTKEQVQDLMKDFTDVSIKEEEWDGACCGEDGKPEKKHWHIFRVVARKCQNKVS